MADDQLFSRFGQEFPPGTVLFREGEGGNQMFVIQSGSVRISKKVRETEKVLAVLPAGEFFGEMAILNNEPRSATATVHEQAKILVIEARTFEAMVRGNSEIAVRLIKKLSRRLHEADKQIENLLLRDPTSRVVHALAYLAETRGAAIPEGIRLELGLDELADRVGLTQPEVDEVFNKLVEQGLVGVYDDGALFLPDVQRMWEFVDFLTMKQKFGGFKG
ncbi:MAG TPA: Crp/Fnr family transcriptional regulator [Myxococcota bacterium]|jgi:CRP-like cAMP-binding protein|nr:Crp/Fnr family transcriptional regulator [Myxococcota bacterium]